MSQPPDPGSAGTVDGIVERLRALKVWAGDPSYDAITARINAAWSAAGRPAGELARRSTVADCFRPGRRRLDVGLVVAAVEALHPDAGYVVQWRQALRVVGGETDAAARVRVHDRLPQAMPGFTGRGAELDRLRDAARATQHSTAVCTVVGMAGVGKTLLALQAGHRLTREVPFDKVLFVNLRAFHPDPAQPPADPAAVLDGFLRLLGVPGHAIPHDLPGRVDAYRRHLAGRRALVVLDDAVDEAQVRPLLPTGPGSLTLITSRRAVAGLSPAAHLPVDVFGLQEAVDLLTGAVPEVPAGPDPDAAARIAEQCGRLPLALGLVAGHIRATPGWTLTDHADRLDQRRRDRRLDGDVELALDVSYRHLPAGHRRLLRALALHPGHDLDVHAAAALTGARLDDTRQGLHELCRDHLLQRTTAGRYTFHDLVRAYAAVRADDEDPPPARRAALTRLFDQYLATAAAAMRALAPAEGHRRPAVDAPGTPLPDLTDVAAARDWLDTERANLVAVAAHTARHGWTGHTTRLSAMLARYLNGGHHHDALTVHGHARDAADSAGDVAGQAHALTHLGATHLRLGDNGTAGDQLRLALELFERVDDPAGQARARKTLGDVEQRLGHYGPAAEHHDRALALFRLAGDHTGEAHALTKLGIVEERLGRYEAAARHHEQALRLFLAAGDPLGEAAAASNLGDVEGRLGRFGTAEAHLLHALRLYRQAGNRDGEAWTSDNLGRLLTRVGEPGRAAAHHGFALAVHRETGEQHGAASALNGLGEAMQAAGRPGDAFGRHSEALAVATATGDRHQRARAHTGLARALRELGDAAAARPHVLQARRLHAELGTVLS